MMEKIKPKTSIKYMEKMGVTTLTNKDNSLPLSLGGLEKGISPLQMAGAYSTIANDGEYIEPTFYTKINTSNGTTIIKTKQKKKRVFSKEVAYIVKELLTQPVLGDNGTATYCKINGVDVAAKTGTTDENYDRWLCGFTPYYTAVTWFGYDQNESVNFNQRNPAGLIWANVMSRIHSGLKTAQFEKPTGITTATICAETGQKATTGCKTTYTEYFLWFTAPGTCDKHSGSELQSNTTTDTNKNVTEIIKGITNEIDEKEPARTTEPTNTTITNNVTTNENKHKTNTNNQNNTTNTTHINTNNNTYKNTTNSLNTNKKNDTNSSSDANTSTKNTTDNNNSHASKNESGTEY